MSVLAFVDLDDTLLGSPRKLPPGEHRPVARGAGGCWQAYQTARQARVLQHLLAHATVIPTTGRSREAFGRVEVRWASWAILDHGATVLTPEGHEDAVWREQVIEHLHAACPQMQAAWQALEADITDLAPGVTLRAATLDGLPLYLVAKHPQRQAGALRPLRRAFDERQGDDLVAFGNDSTLTLMPRAVGKAAAVRYVRSRLDPDGQALTVGVGDTLSDVPFMRECDFCVSPADSQVMRALGGLSLVGDEDD